jgi:hypothetical protein
MRRVFQGFSALLAALPLAAQVPPKEADRSNFKPPDGVAAAVKQALFEAKPKRRYLVVPNADEGERTIPRQLDQLNEGQPYTYDRTALIKIVDESLAASRPRTP